MDLIFHGPLGMELSLNKSTGVARVKAAEHDSPAQLVVGRALTAIEGVPVGEIRDKKSWLAVVAKLQAPERPLSLSFEAPSVSPEEPVQPVQRARAELDALGFVWDDLARRWEEVRDALVTYKELHGNLQVPDKFAVPSEAPWPKGAWGVKLGLSVKNIRHNGDFVWRGNYAETHPERRAELDAMGFRWRE